MESPPREVELEVLTLCQWVLTAEAHLHEVSKRLTGRPAPPGVRERFLIIQHELRVMRLQLRHAPTVSPPPEAPAAQPAEEVRP